MNSGNRNPSILGAIAGILDVDHDALGKWLAAGRGNQGRGGAKPCFPAFKT